MPPLETCFSSTLLWELELPSVQYFTQPQDSVVYIITIRYNPLYPHCTFCNDSPLSIKWSSNSLACDSGPSTVNLVVTHLYTIIPHYGAHVHIYSSVMAPHVLPPRTLPTPHLSLLFSLFKAPVEISLPLGRHSTSLRPFMLAFLPSLPEFYLYSFSVHILMFMNVYMLSIES